MRNYLAFLLAPTLLGVLLLIALIGEQPPTQLSQANRIPLITLSQIFN